MQLKTRLIILISEIIKLKGTHRQNLMWNTNYWAKQSYTKLIISVLSVKQRF